MRYTQKPRGHIVMSGSFDQHFKQIRRRVRHVLWIYGCSWLIAVLFTATLSVGIIDWLLHLNDSGVRLILGLGILLSSTWVAWKFLIAPLAFSLSDVSIALRIERQFPGFRDSLTSTVQFLSQGNDPTTGSPQLQQVVAEQTLAKFEHIDAAEIVDRREAVRVAIVAFCVCVVTAVVVGLNQVEAATAINRLVLPFAGTQWPKDTQLRLVNSDLEPLDHDPEDPLRMARGDTLDVLVENLKGKLPRRVYMQYKFFDDQLVQEELRKTTSRDHRGRVHEVAVATIHVAKGPLEFRAIGGDDQEMPWYRLNVVPSPIVEDLQVTLFPPSYTAEPAVQLPPGVGHVQGLIGTTVSIQAICNKPLKSANVRIKTSTPIAATLSSDGLKFDTSFQITEAGVSSYWFAFKDKQGFENNDAPRYEIRGIADRIPDIYIERPPTDLQVTPDANLPVRVVVKEDLGLKQVWLKYQLEQLDDSTTTDIILHTAAGGHPKELFLDYLWSLADLQLKQGTRVTFFAEAVDYCDLGSDHVGRSVARTLMIVSHQAKADELAMRQAELLDELDTVAKTQNRSRDQIAELRIQLDAVGQFRAEDLDLLKRVELDQRQISSRLVNPVDGVSERTQEILEELAYNHLNDVETEIRLNSIAAEITELREDVLPAIEQQLTRSRKTAQSLPRTDARANSEELGVSLARAEEHQSAVLGSLDEMRHTLSQWRNYRDLVGDLSSIESGQLSLIQQTVETGKNTLTKSFTELKPQEQADLAKLRDKQRRNSDKLEEFRKKLQNAAEGPSPIELTSTESLSDALDHLDRQATVGRMREAAEQLEKNQIGQASLAQDQVLNDLNELQDILRNRLMTDAQQLVKRLQLAEHELETLKDRQEDLLRRAQTTQDSAQHEQGERLEQLRKEQQTLRQNVANMARRLRRLQAQRSTAAAQRAVARMQQAETELQNASDAGAVEFQQEALKNLDQAQRELATAQRQAEERLAAERLESIADNLQGLVARQQTVISEIVRIDTEHRERIEREAKPVDNWKRRETRTLRDLADVQLGLKQETDDLAEQIKIAAVLALALRGAAQSMEQTAERLVDKITNEETLRLAESAKQRFVDLVGALNASKQQQSANEPSPSTAGEAASDGRQATAIAQLAQLIMLRTLQVDLNKQIAEFDENRQQHGQPTEDEVQIVQELATRQAELADLTRDLTGAIVETLEN